MGTRSDRTQLAIPLPGDLRLRPDSVLRFRVSVSGGTARVRTSLITPAREVFRHDLDPLIRPAGRIIETRVGDFTPAFWNRVGAGDPTKAGYLTVDLYGLEPGCTLDLGQAEVIEPE